MVLAFVWYLPDSWEVIEAKNMEVTDSGEYVLAKAYGEYNNIALSSKGAWVEDLGPLPNYYDDLSGLIDGDPEPEAYSVSYEDIEIEPGADKYPTDEDFANNLYYIGDDQAEYGWDRYHYDFGYAMTVSQELAVHFSGSYSIDRIDLVITDDDGTEDCHRQMKVWGQLEGSSTWTELAFIPFAIEWDDASIAHYYLNSDYTAGFIIGGDASTKGKTYFKIQFKNPTPPLQAVKFEFLSVHDKNWGDLKYTEVRIYTPPTRYVEKGSIEVKPVNSDGSEFTKQDWEVWVSAFVELDNPEMAVLTASVSFDDGKTYYSCNVNGELLDFSNCKKFYLSNKIRLAITLQTLDISISPVIEKIKLGIENDTVPPEGFSNFSARVVESSTGTKVYVEWSRVYDNGGIKQYKVYYSQPTVLDENASSNISNLAKTVQALPTDPEVYSCVFDIPWTGVNVYVKVVAEDGAGLTCQTSPIMTPIYISSSGGTIGLSEAITVYFPEGTVFDDTKVVLKKVSLSSDMDDSSLGKYIKPGAKARVAFSLEIGDAEIVRRPLKITINFGQLGETVEKDLALFYWDGSFWEYIGGNVDLKQNTLTAFLNHSSVYAVFEATRPEPSVRLSWNKAVFSPNGDGVNDKISIGFSVVPASRVTVSIINSRGQEILKLLDNEFVSSVHLVWDGRDFYGRLVPIGVYYYVIKVEKGKAYKGLIVLVR